MGVTAANRPTGLAADRPHRTQAEADRSDPLLQAVGIRRSYGSRVVLALDRLEVRAGEVLGILGPNGAGKSTLFRTLLLLERPAAGRIYFEGREVRAGDRLAMRRMAGVFQRPFAFAGTVEQNVAYGLAVRGLDRRDRRRRALTALGWLGVEHLAQAPMQALSGGEHQRVALARALVIEPDLLWLDEPTANLDVAVRRRFREDLERAVRSHARAAVVITHDAADAFALADRIAVIEEGRITQLGTPTDLVLDPATPFVAAFAGAELLLDGVVTRVEDGLVTIVFGRDATAVAVAEPGQSFRPGQPVHVAYRPEDVALASTGSGETSARNRFDVRVAGLYPAGALMRLRLEGAVTLAALVTRDSLDRLSLAPGGHVEARLKASALRLYAAAAAPATGHPSGGPGVARVAAPGTGRPAADAVT